MNKITVQFELSEVVDSDDADIIQCIESDDLDDIAEFREKQSLEFEAMGFKQIKAMLKAFGNVTHGGVYNGTGLVCILKVSRSQVRALNDFVQDKRDAGDDSIFLDGNMTAADFAVNGRSLEDYADSLCDECGDDMDGGEGYDGLCGNCADRKEAHND